MFLMLPVGENVFISVVGKDPEYTVGPNGMLLTVFAVLIVHELLHAVGYLLAKRRPSFGVGMLGVLPVVYTTSKDNKKMTLRQMLVTGYLPFVALSILLIIHGIIFPEHRQITSFAFIINFAASAADLFMASKFWKYLRFKNVMVLDTKSGSDIYSSDKEAIELSRTSTKKHHST